MTIKAQTGPGAYLTVAQAAELACCSVKTIRRGFRTGGLTAFRLPGGNRVLIREDDLRAWIESQTAAETNAPLASRQPARRALPGPPTGPVAAPARRGRPPAGSVAALRQKERELTA